MFFLISVKMDLQRKVMGFQLEPEKSIFNQEVFYLESSDEGDAMEHVMFGRKDCDPSVWCKCRNCSTMKTEMECLCLKGVDVYTVKTRTSILTFRIYLFCAKENFIGIDSKINDLYFHLLL